MDCVLRYRSLRSSRQTRPDGFFGHVVRPTIMQLGGAVKPRAQSVRALLFEQADFAEVTLCARVDLRERRSQSPKFFFSSVVDSRCMRL